MRREPKASSSELASVVSGWWTRELVTLRLAVLRAPRALKFEVEISVCKQEPATAHAGCTMTKV